MKWNDKDEAERAEKFTMQQQEDNQEPTSLEQEENDVCGQKELKVSEGDIVLQQDTCDPEEMLQTEGSNCLGVLELIFKALEREDRLLISQKGELQMRCRDMDWIFKDVSEIDKADSAEKVTVMTLEDQIQEPDSSVQKEDDVCTQEKLKTSKVENNEVEQLKMCYERTAERYQAEKKEKEALQKVIQELNIKLQNQMDLQTLHQLNASKREKVLSQEIDDIQQTRQKKCDEDCKLQAWEKEKKTYLQEIEHLKLCYEGKTLRFHNMFQKLKAEKDQKEAIKGEQFNKIQALHNKVKQQQDFYIQQQVKASEKEKMLSVKLEELQEKILCFEKGAHPKRRVNMEDENGIDENHECSRGQKKKKKKRKGWKKVAYYVKPWHWGGKKKRP